MSELSKTFLCKYQVENLILMLGEKYIQLDHSNIISIEYLNDYDSHLRAILKVSLRIDVRRKIWILKNKRDIVAKLELNKIGIDIDCEQPVTNPETVWNHEFSIYFNDVEESTDTKLMEERISKNEGSPFASQDIDNENYFETQNMLDIYLFDQKLLNASNNIYNDTFTADTLQFCVGKLLTKSKHDNVLMSRFENDEIYEELLVPALPSYKSLIYLDQYYGFYKTGAIIYYDIDKLYILNSNGRITVKEDGEWPETTIMISQLDSSSPGNGMIRKEGEKRFYISINEMNINPQQPSIANNNTDGSKSKVVITDDITIDNTLSNQSFIGQRNERITYTKKDSNKFIGSIIKARMEENECVLYINGDNLDINAFTPNKEYQVIFEETSKMEAYGKYKYRLAYAYHFLRLESDNYMASSHQIILKRACIIDEGIIE